MWLLVGKNLWSEKLTSISDGSVLMPVKRFEDHMIIVTAREVESIAGSGVSSACTQDVERVVFRGDRQQVEAVWTRIVETLISRSMVIDARDTK